MDCEKFESVMIDELYGELDELTSAAVRRHAAGCARCAALLDGLRATRRVATIPLVDVPAGLEGRILAAAADVQDVAPLQWRLARVVSLAGSWAMRPQTAMAAVFMVMIGTSVLILRGRSSRAPASAEMTVTEEGTPAPVGPGAPEPTVLTGAAPPTAVGSSSPAEKAVVFAVPPPPAEPPGDSTRARAPQSGCGPQARRRDAPTAGGGGLAKRSGGRVRGGRNERRGGRRCTRRRPRADGGRRRRWPQKRRTLRGFDPNAPPSPRHEPRATPPRARACPAPRWLASTTWQTARPERVGPGWDALFEGALCYESMGDFSNARNRLNVLLRVDSYKDRARAQLDQLNQVQAGGGAAAGGRAAPKARADTGQVGAAAAPPAASPVP